MVSLNVLSIITLILFCLLIPITFIKRANHLVLPSYYLFITLLFIVGVLTVVNEFGYGYKRFEYTDRNITKTDDIDKLYIGADTAKWEIAGELNSIFFTDVVFKDAIEKPYIGTYKLEIGPVYVNRDALVIPGSKYEEVMETLKNKKIDVKLAGLTQIY